MTTPPSSAPRPAETTEPAYPTLTKYRSVYAYERLNRIAEGSYGIVYRARDKHTGQIVALKKLKLTNETQGFPITSLREAQTLLLSKHPHIVDVKDIVFGPTLTDVYFVFEYIEHDLKSLLEEMRTPLLQSEVKTLMLQLLQGVAMLHDNWIIHRDLKPSNLLMSNRGMIKIADFGLARRYGSPLGHMTQLVVTLWYRAPELLLGAKEYTTAIDMWSIGCIFAELIERKSLFQGRGEMDQLNQIFKLLGTPNERVWPGFAKLPHVQTFNFTVYPPSNVRTRFMALTENGLDLLLRLLTFDPTQRITAEEALAHPYFTESPMPKDPCMFPTWPSKSSGERVRMAYSPSVPEVEHAKVLFDMPGSSDVID